ncbi:AGE family epimerase/isomerase [Phaeobacter sp. HF9A]|uniref:AGE family epimerase/isomerase n=1 Tax=Phaeobacter sp. HF9A TaxID=2721561 RepID=UPI0014315EEA|nr:AGE family epimerase/isomerase [Phaeobacter sp. HF9A]NIZ13803.1 AGE family epimerase/isomerase [Phaeobacter sp. HF9A]
MSDTPITIETVHGPEVLARIKSDARAQLRFFRRSLCGDGRFASLTRQGVQIMGPQALITTTRLVHSYALGHLAGVADCLPMVDAGMQAIWHSHRDTQHGGYVWSFDSDGPVETDKLAYGHMFVLLAAASAEAVGHPDARRLREDVSEVITEHFWDAEAGLMQDEFRRDWSVFSGYRGMNANMHGVEAHLSAYEITGDGLYLERAGRILAFFVDRMAASNKWRLPEHYHQDWSVDRAYEGDPMFRPRGTTPGHSFELGRLLIQHWDLAGRGDDSAPVKARALIETALADAWLPEGGLAYTLNSDGTPRVRDRYWWPVTEAIGALASLLKLGGTAQDKAWYERLWQTGFALFVDDEHGGWIPEIGADGLPAERQFAGKPDIYHALQANLYPLHGAVSGHYRGVVGLLAQG